jgi:hypothetical protein
VVIGLDGQVAFDGFALETVSVGGGGDSESDENDSELFHDDFPLKESLFANELREALYGRREGI